MALNKVLPVSMVLEIIMICIHGTTSAWDTYPHNSWIDIVDEIYMSCVPIILFASVVWVVYLRAQKFTRKSRNVRFYEAGVLALMGGLMLWTAFGVRQLDDDCNRFGGTRCEAYELRTISGLLPLVDSFLHLLNPTLPDRVRDRPPPFPTSPSNGVYVISNDLPSYEPPPSYFDLPPEQQVPQRQVLSPAAAATAAATTTTTPNVIDRV